MNARPTSGWTTTIRFAASLAVVATLFGACAGPAVPSEEHPDAPTTPAPTTRTTPSASPSSAPAASATAATSCVEHVLAGMTTPQRIGQLFLLGLAHDRLGPAEQSAIRAQHVGSVWFTTKTAVGVDEVRAVADAVQAEAGPASTAGVGFFVGANQEGGLVQAMNGPRFSTIPSALVQGKQPIGALAADARGWGRELAAAGVNLDFAPVSDVVPVSAVTTNQPIGVLKREYGHTPAIVGSHVAAFVKGMSEAGVATTAKHFPGLGRVVGNTDFSSGVVDDVTVMGDPDLASFQAAIGAGVPFVMIALATYTRIDPEHLAAFSPIVIQDMLRGSMGFRGVIMSDDMGATAAVAGVPAGQRALDFLMAGGDLIVSKTAGATVAMVAAVHKRVATDPAAAARVDDAVRRVLAAKQSANLLPC